MTAPSGTLLAEDLPLLRCPACGAKLDPRSRGALASHLVDGVACTGCGRDWPFRGGFLRLLDPVPGFGAERLMQVIYDTLAPLHDPAARWIVPVLQGIGEDEARSLYLPRLELSGLEARRDGRPVRILEVGIGTGMNLPLLQREIPPGLPVEVWGVDFSEGMLRLCAERARGRGGPRVRLLLADAHRLPFPDAAFDRVFHVGGISGYRDAGRALGEMARVARRGTPIVVVDEQLERARRCSPVDRVKFFLLTFYNPGSSSPVDELPPGAEVVADEQLTRYYYGLTFRMPGSRRRRSAGG